MPVPVAKIREYDGFARGELEHAMASSPPPPHPRHRIGIVMSSVGRFLPSVCVVIAAAINPFRFSTKVCPR
jgi:hypothetical protein